MVEANPFIITKIYWAIEERIKHQQSFKDIPKEKRDAIESGLRQAKDIIHNYTGIKDPRK